MIPGSYTHLEVDKRQLNEREPLRSGGAPRPVGKVVIGVVAGDIHDIGKDIIVSLLRAERFEVVAVSYTHLDVYKRQAPGKAG